MDDLGDAVFGGHMRERALPIFLRFIKKTSFGQIFPQVNHLRLSLPKAHLSSHHSPWPPMKLLSLRLKSP